MVTYSQKKPPVNPLYIKRLVHGNSTLPLQGTFTPYKAVVRKRKHDALEAKLVDTEQLEPSQEPAGGSKPRKKKKRRRLPTTADPEETQQEPWERAAYAIDDVLRDMGFCSDDQLLVPSDPSGDET